MPQPHPLPAALTPQDQHQTIADQLADRLGWEIVFRRIAPGARLREHELAERYGVSRPVIREVLPKLEVQGLVETAPWRGARVPVLSRTELSDLFEFAALAFGFNVRLATERATERQLAAIGACIAQIEAMAEEPGVEAEAYEVARTCVAVLISQSMGEATEFLQRRPMVRRIRHQFVLDAIRTQNQRRASARRWRTLFTYMNARDTIGAEAHAKAMVLATREAGLTAHAALNSPPQA